MKAIHLCHLAFCALIMGAFSCGVSHAVLVSKLIQGPVSASGPSSQQFLYDSASIEFDVDPTAINWMALSRSPGLVDAATGANGNVAPDGMLDILNPNSDDYIELQVTHVESGMASATTILDDNGVVNEREGTQAMIVGSYPSVWAVTSVRFFPLPIITYSSTFAESGALSGAFNQGPGKYKIDLDFHNRYSTAAGHGSVYLLMDVEPRELLRRSVAVETGQDEPRRIDVVLTPRDPFGQTFDLQQLADAYGVDHFNWLNSMTTPDSWQVEILKDVPFSSTAPLVSFDADDGTFRYNDGSAKDGQVVTSAGILNHAALEDPLRQTGVSTPSNAPGTASNLAYFIHPAADGDPVGIDHTGFDDQAPYWNEVDPGFGRQTIADVTSNSLSIVPFSDEPSFPDGLFADDEFVQFETQLVGVRSDGSLLRLPVRVEWKTNAAHDGVFDATAHTAITADQLPPLVSGGVFDVQVAVPEPATIALLAWACILFGGTKWQQAKRDFFRRL